MMRLSKIFPSIAGIATVALLTFGIAFGVVLVKQDQEFREKASEVRENKIAICHKTGSDSNPWVQIEVSENAKESHLSHGDIQGNCPTQEKDKDKGKGNDDKDNGRGGQGGTSLAQNVTVNNQTVAAAEVKVETKYIYVNSSFEFRIKFQGINDKKDKKIVRVVLRQEENELHVYNKVEVVPNDKGIYRGVITDIKPGVYNVYIKGDGYLQRKFENINFKKGRNSYDWTGKELLAGDFNGDNFLKAEDVARFMSYYVEDLNPVTQENKVFDLDMNKRVDLHDLKLVLANYENLNVEGEN